MKAFRFFSIPLLLALIGQPAMTAISDPYEIMARHYAAIGGVEKLKAQKTSYSEGTITIEGTGLGGTFKSWTETPLKNRQEVDLTIIKQLSGDNGEYIWTVDHNGKLQIVRDSLTMKERRLKKLLSEFEHLDRDSKNFKMTLEGIDTAQSKPCYVIRTTNSLTIDTSFDYYDTTAYVHLKNISHKSDQTSQTIFSDYRDVGGVLLAFSERTVSYPTEQVVVVTIAKIETNIPIAAEIFEPPAEGTADFRFANGKSAENIPFEYIENHIYIPITINGITRLWALDSGAERSVVEEDFARELGLTLEGNIKGTGVGNVVDVSFATLPPFALPGLEFGSQKIVSIKLNWLFQKWGGFDIAGILGYDFLSRVVTKVDYANERLSFYLPDSFQYSGTGVVLDAPVSKDNMFHLPVTVDGKYSGIWNLDLGAGGSSFHYPYAEQNGILNLPGFSHLGAGAGGTMMEKTARFKTIEFAGFIKENPHVSWPIEKGKGAFSGKELAGNIGNTLLRHFVLYLDYKKQQVIVEKGDNYDKIFPRDNSGLQVMKADSGGVEIVNVADRTPGAEAGFMVGDIIQTVNGLDINQLGGILEILRLFRDTPGTTYAIEITRGGESKNMRLTLRDYFE